MGLPVSASILRRDVGSDLYEVGVELATVPLLKGPLHLGDGHPQHLAHHEDYVSAISCMSTYSMPLWTIFT